MELQFVNLLPSPSISVEEDSIPVSLVQIFRGADGADGKPGNGVEAAHAVCAQDIAAGMPIIVGRVDGKLYLAKATGLATSFVVGLALATVASGFVADAVTALYPLADWTAVTGSAALSPGQPYYLAPEGGLSLVPPGIRGQAIVEVGVAVNTTTLLVAPKQPIVL